MLQKNNFNLFPMRDSRTHTFESLISIVGKQGTPPVTVIK